MQAVSRTKWVAYLSILVFVFIAAILALWLSYDLRWYDLVLGVICGVLATAMFAILVASLAYLYELLQSRVKVVAVGERMPFSDLLSKAASEVDISGITLENALNELCPPGFGSDKLVHIGHKEGLTIRLLFCDPRSSYLVDRAHWEEGDNVKRLKYDVWVSIAKICIIAQRYDELSCGIRLIVKILNKYVLSCTTFRSGDLLISGPYLAIDQGKKTMRVQITMHRNKTLFCQLRDDFNELWAKADPLISSTPRVGMVINFDLLKQLELDQKGNFNFLELPCVKEGIQLSYNPTHRAIFEKAQEVLKIYYPKSTKKDIE